MTNPNWSKIPNHLHRTIKNGRPESRKIDYSFNLISHQPDIDKTYLYVKDARQN